MGHICKICEKDGRLFATHSFKILGISHDHFLLYILVGVFCLGSSWAKLAKNDILSVCSMAIRVVEFSNGCVFHSFCATDLNFGAKNNGRMK